MEDLVIIGAGPAGLTASRELSITFSKPSLLATNSLSILKDPKLPPYLFHYLFQIQHLPKLKLQYPQVVLYLYTEYVQAYLKLQLKVPQLGKQLTKDILKRC